MKNMIPKLLSGAVAAALALTLLPAVTSASGSEYTVKGATEFTFSDSGSAAEDGSYAGYKLSGTDLTIQDSGTYIVSGSCADGSITVKKGTTSVTLVLDGLTLTSSDTAPIACNKSSEVTIVAASGTTNTLTDSAQNNDDSYPDNENTENAVIKCKDGFDVTICGSGTLNITANGKNGIKSGATTEEEGDASLTIRDVILTIDAPVNDAINAEQQLDIESGTLTISAGDDAIHCDYVMNVGAAGTSGPSITITACCEGLEAATLNIFSGDIDIIASDDCLNAANSDLTNYDFSMTISGGTIHAYTSSGDGFDSNGDLTISGGTVVVLTANTADDQALDADGTLTVSGGTSALAAKGSSFSIQDSSGSTVYSGTALCSANYVFFSSSKLSADASYTLCSGSTSAATATAQTGTASADLTGFSDQAAISSFARPAMSWAKASGLMDGNDTGALAPKGAATRAQMAMILTRLCEKAV